MNSQNGKLIVKSLILAAVSAGKAILDAKNASLQIGKKSDGSTITSADFAAERAIFQVLARDLPQMAVISEETKAGSAALSAMQTGVCLVIDPLDGTREFARGGQDYCVCIGLSENAEAVDGVIYAPETAQLWWSEGGIAYSAKVDAGFDMNAPQGARLFGASGGGRSRRAIMSGGHALHESLAFAQALHCAEYTLEGSALKFCRIAEGKADIYPRFGPTMVWDTLAGEALVKAVGGLVLRGDGHSMASHRREGVLLNPDFVGFARRDEAEDWGRARLARQ